MKQIIGIIIIIFFSSCNHKNKVEIIKEEIQKNIDKYRFLTSVLEVKETPDKYSVKLIYENVDIDYNKEFSLYLAHQINQHEELNKDFEIISYYRKIEDASITVFIREDDKNMIKFNNKYIELLEFCFSCYKEGDGWLLNAQIEYFQSKYKNIVTNESLFQFLKNFSKNENIYPINKDDVTMLFLYDFNKGLLDLNMNEFEKKENLDEKRERERIVFLSSEFWKLIKESDIENEIKYLDEVLGNSTD